MIPVPSATQWGSTTASKRALLLHGNSCSSHTWETVAQGLANAGFLAIAPNLLGHGNRLTNNFHLPTFAQDIHSAYFADGSEYDVIIGHSFGGTVTLQLLPLLQLQLAPPDQNDCRERRRTAVILVDPAIAFGDEVLDVFATENGKEIGNPRSVEAYMMENPTWKRQDAVSRLVALQTAQNEVPRQIFDHNKPFAYGHLFDEMPPHIEMTVIIADPELSSVCPPEMVPVHPQIRSVITVKGSGHWIHHENPDVIVKTAVDEEERLCIAKHY